MFRRGEIYYVDFGENTATSVQSGIRPALIVSNNRANRYSPVITVVPLTTKTWKKRYQPTHVFLSGMAGFGLSRNSMVLAEQLLSVDKSRIRDKIGEITDVETMARITKAVQIQIGVMEQYN